jgi:hypothetical protein
MRAAQRFSEVLIEHMPSLNLASALEHWELVAAEDTEIMMAAPASPLPPG